MSPPSRPSLPTHRKSVSFGPEADDTDIIHEHRQALNHRAALQAFQSNAPHELFAAWLRSLELHAFRTTGGWPPGPAFQSSESAAFPAPAGFALVARTQSHRMYLSEAASWLALDQTHYNGGLHTRRTVLLTETQARDVVQHLLAAPTRPQSCSAPLEAMHRYISGMDEVRVDRQALGRLALAQPAPAFEFRITDTWQPLARAVYADEHRAANRGPYAHLCVHSAFATELPHTSASATPEELVSVGVVGGALLKRLVDRNEAEPDVCAFRQVDGGTQVLTLAEAPRGWNACLYTEVLGVLKVQSASFSDRAALLGRMKQEADIVLGIAPVALKALDKGIGRD